MSVLRTPGYRCDCRTRELVSPRPFHRVVGAPSRRRLRCQQQLLATKKQIHQGAGDKQAVPVLLQSPVAHFHEPELQLHHLKHMLDLSPYLRLRPVLRPRHPVHDLILIATAPLGKIPRSRRALANHPALSLISPVAPHPCLFAVQQVGQNGHVGNMGCRRHRRVDELGLAVHAHVRLHPEVPVLSLLRLVHLWVPALLTVFGRTGRMDQGCIHNRAAADPHPFGLQVQVHCPQNLFSQVVLFQQVAKLAHRGLVRHRLRSQINPRKLAQRRRVVQRLFHRWVRQIEPMLEKINPQHLLQLFRPPSVARPRIVRLDQGAQLRPRHHLLHLLQEYCPPRLLRVPFESRHHRQCPLLPQRVHPGTTLSTLAVEREHLIRVSLELSRDSSERMRIKA